MALLFISVIIAVNVVLEPIFTLIHDIDAIITLTFYYMVAVSIA